MDDKWSIMFYENKEMNKKLKKYSVFWGREGVRQLKTFLMITVKLSAEQQFDGN